jgi:hypothetical protein
MGFSLSFKLTHLFLMEKTGEKEETGLAQLIAKISLETCIRKNISIVSDPHPMAMYSQISLTLWARIAWISLRTKKG